MDKGDLGAAGGEHRAVMVYQIDAIAIGKLSLAATIFVRAVRRELYRDRPAR